MLQVNLKEEVKASSQLLSGQSNSAFLHVLLTDEQAVPFIEHTTC